jgi:hypothetical protein
LKYVWGRTFGSVPDEPGAGESLSGDAGSDNSIILAAPATFRIFERICEL